MKNAFSFLPPRAFPALPVPPLPGSILWPILVEGEWPAQHLSRLPPVPPVSGARLNGWPGSTGQLRKLKMEIFVEIFKDKLEDMDVSLKMSAPLEGHHFKLE